MVSAAPNIWMGLLGLGVQRKHAVWHVYLNYEPIRDTAFRQLAGDHGMGTSGIHVRAAHQQYLLGSGNDALYKVSTGGFEKVPY